MSYSLDVRKVEEDQYDGSTGAKIESITSYQLGATIDGVFVPFLTKQGGYVESLVARGKESAAASSTSEPATASSGDGETAPPAGTAG